MSGNWRGGPSTFAKLSRIFRQTFAKIRLEVVFNLTRKLQTPTGRFLLVGGCFCSGEFLRRPSGGQLWSAGILPALPVNTHGSSLQLPVSKPPLHKTFANKKLTFATPFAELSRRSTPRPKGLPLHSSIQGPFGRLSYICSRPWTPPPLPPQSPPPPVGVGWVGGGVVVGLWGGGWVVVCQPWVWC